MCISLSDGSMSRSEPEEIFTELNVNSNMPLLQGMMAILIFSYLTHVRWIKETINQNSSLLLDVSLFFLRFQENLRNNRVT